MKRVYEACEPRHDVLEGVLVEDVFAAELTPVVDNKGPEVYRDSAKFFTNTFPTLGLRALMYEVFMRLAGKGGNSLVRLETTFGGGKTHALIALWHAAKKPDAAPDELLPPDLRPRVEVRVAAISGRDFGVEGRDHSDGTHTHTLWGEIAWQLGGKEAHKLVAVQDRQYQAPSGDTLSKVLGEGPVLVMIDELGRYMRTGAAKKLAGAGTLADQVPAFLHSLSAAASMHPQAVVVITLAGEQDAYAEENEEVRRRLKKADKAVAETQKVAARQEFIIEPTQEEEVAHVVVRRLFEHVDEAAAAEVAEKYHEAYEAYEKRGASLPKRARNSEYRNRIKHTYPFDPELLRVLMTKTSTIPEFQRTRGALRLLAQVVRSVWQRREPDAYLIGLPHVDFGSEPIRHELTSRLGPDRAELAPVIQADIYSDTRASHAQQLDEGWSARSKPPLASRIARTIFVHSLTYGRACRAEVPDVLLAVAQPELDAELLREALAQLESRCWYLHHDEQAFWFDKEASLNKVIDEQLEQISTPQAKEECRKRIRSIYAGSRLHPVFFPERPADVEDDPEHTKLCVLDFDFVTLRSGESVPDRVQRIYERTGTQESFRQHKNAIMFLVADTENVADMVGAAKYQKALERITKTPEIAGSLNEANRRAANERAGKGELELRVAISRAYRHLLVPNPDASSDGSGLQAIMLDVEQAARIERESKPGKPGQERVILEALKEAAKIIEPEGPPPAPSLVMDYGWPKGQQQMTTGELVRVFRRNPRLPMLFDTHRLRETVSKGIKEECWVYFDGKRAWNRVTGPPPEVDIVLGDQHELLTLQEANARGLCYKCGYRPCKCGPKQRCPKCGQEQAACRCAPCPTCGKKPWECICDHKQDFVSSWTSPQKAFTELQDWVRDAKVERIEWLEVQCQDRVPDLQQVWTGMQYLTKLENITVQFEGSAELAYLKQAAYGEGISGDEVKVEFRGGGNNFRRIYDFFWALTQHEEHVQYFAKLKAQLATPLPPDAGEIGDLRKRLEDGGVQQITLKATPPQRAARNLEGGNTDGTGPARE